MDKPRSASDKIRPFLEAMERSINRVRHQRLQESGEVNAAAKAPSSNGHRGGFSASSPSAPSPSPATPAPPAAPSARPASHPAHPYGGGHPHAALQRPAALHDDAVIGAPASPHRNPAQPDSGPGGDSADKPQRLKAKPKRPSSFSDASLDANRYRSQAG